MIEGLGIEYDYVDLTKDSIEFEELKTIYKEQDLPIKKYFNTSGIVYRENNIKDKFDELNEDELLKLISENGLLLKRPFIIDKKIYIGNQIDQLENDYK